MKFAPETFFIQVIQVDIFADKDNLHQYTLRVGEMCTFGAFEINGWLWNAWNRMPQIMDDLKGFH